MLARQYAIATCFAAMLIATASGCAEGRGQVPTDATLIGEQTGRLFYFGAARGTIYILDSKTGKVVYTTAVNPGDKVVLYPEKKQIIFNGQAISQPDLSQDRLYRLYFLPRG